MNNELKRFIKMYYQSRFKKTSSNYFSIPASGKKFDEKELLLGVEAVLDGWWTEGRFAKKFEKKFSKFLGIHYVSLVNSGSSANLLAFSALTSSLLKEKAIVPGSEVITVAASFPTTVNPIIIKNCIPVFVDIDIETGNIDISQVEKAITKKTKAIMIAHTLGNPFNLKKIMKLVKKYNLWLIEDCCDALGSKYEGRMIGTFGDVATFSFYPAHQITMGEGGAVVTNNPLLHRAIRQFRDWGRDCWCDTGVDNTCGKRFCWKMGKLPLGYDHKFIYTQIGYNLKLTDMQAAIGLAQLDKLSRFIKSRKENFIVLYKFFQQYEKYFFLPKREKCSDPCWFGFMLTIRKDAPFRRTEILQYLESKKIGTRNLFAGNLINHPAYTKTRYRKIGQLENTNLAMKNSFWIGVHPGISKKMLSFMTQSLSSFLERHI